MKVLLFVQTGDARPKCKGAVLKFPTWKGPPRPHVQVDGWWYTQKQADARYAADRWWLVECENAEDGRFVIACDRARPLRGHWASVGPEGSDRIVGRILASGGRS